MHFFSCEQNAPDENVIQILAQAHEKSFPEMGLSHRW